MQRLLPILLILALSGCSLIPEYQRPNVPVPAQWSPQTAPTTDLTPDAWWTRFASPALDALVDQALIANQDLAAGVARIRQARAVATIAGAPLWPQLDVGWSATDSDRSGGSDNLSSTTQSGTRSSTQLTLAYELDLFGRVAATRSAARSRFTVSQFDLHALRLLISGDTAQAAINLAATRERLRLAQVNLETTRAVLAVLEAQFAAGRVSALERDQQRTVVATTEASLAALTQTEASSRNQLALLTGMATPQFQAPDIPWTALTLPDIMPTVPAALLIRRPDLCRVEAELMAAGADIGAARAALYPSMQIGWDRAWTRSPTATLTTLSASALAPLFRGGALRGEVTYTEARRKELVANYRQAVLTAYREVSDALDAQRQSALRSAALDQAALAARAAYDGARARFDAGAVDYAVLLDAQRSLITANDAAVSARLDRFTAAVSLYRALGGGSVA